LDAYLDLPLDMEADHCFVLDDLQERHFRGVAAAFLRPGGWRSSLAKMHRRTSMILL
jgi:hypothetical protein